MSEPTEQVNFNLNLDQDGKFHIHSEQCYVMFRESGAGLAKINRALKPYHHFGNELDEGWNSSVGNPHDICLMREKLQEMRFELL